MNRSRLGKLLILGFIAFFVVAGVFYFYSTHSAGTAAWVVSGNGRLEATEVDVATKIAGRLGKVLPREGDLVQEGSVVVLMDADDLRAQLRAAQAQVQQARKALDEARAGVRKSKTDVALAGKTLKRSEALVSRGFISREKLDSDQTSLEGSMAGEAQAYSRVGAANAAVATAEAHADSLRVTLADTSLMAPITGRVLYRLAEPGEVLAAGGKALTLLDLSDMYMTIYLPTDKAGQVALNSEARIVLDALPKLIIPASVSFVAPKAQFTPREVETRSEREKLMFRVKIKADPAWIAAHRDLAKGGMPGVGYVRLDANMPWPANLHIDGK